MSSTETTGVVAGGTDGGKDGTGSGETEGGGAAQPASVPTISAPSNCQGSRFMGLILLEALGALVLLVLIVWWTMFSGRDKGELRSGDSPQPPVDEKSDPK
jgi:hypothetical protein